MRALLMSWILMILVICPSAHAEPAVQGQAVKIYTSEESFEDVVDNIKIAIVDRGIPVSGTLHISDMLNRTAPDLGFSEVFSQAEAVEFCNAVISHKMVQVAAENVVICPFTIAVYVKKSEPGRVYVAYRLPLLAGDAKEVTEEILEMLDGIVQDSL